MMTRDYIQQHDIVMKYLRGELSVAEQAAFETFYLDDPETLDELEAASALKEHLPRQASPAASRWFSLPVVVGSAVSLLLGMASVLPFKFRDESFVQANIRTIAIDTNRGAESVIRIDRRPDEKLILLRIPISTSEEGLTLLLSRNGDEVLETSGLASDYLGDVLLAVPVGKLSEGPTLLTLRRANGTVLAEEQISVN